MDKPLVSIVIPVYNGANYLSEAIECALAQTYDNKEIVVVNDGSCDEGATEKVALSYGDAIRYYPKENGGVSTALNYGIKHAKGEWISWLSHDDLYTPDKVEVQVADMQKALNAGIDVEKTMFYCAGGFINATGERIAKNQYLLPEGWYSGYDFLAEYYRGHSLGGCGLLIPKHMFEEVSYFEEDMRYMQDVFMWQKAFLAGYGIYINSKVMSITRVHNMQTSTTGKKYLLVDRERVGNYMKDHLGDKVTSNGTSLLMCYMYYCAKRNNLKIAKSIYEKMSKEGQLKVAEKLRYRMVCVYGKLRKKLVTVYYRLRFGTKR